MKKATIEEAVLEALKAEFSAEQLTMSRWSNNGFEKKKAVEDKVKKELSTQDRKVNEVSLVSRSFKQAYPCSQLYKDATETVAQIEYRVDFGDHLEEGTLTLGL